MAIANTPAKGIIFDLDGVLTLTAHLHALAWKETFDRYGAYRVEQGEPAFSPFSINSDYPRYVDGLPRFDGVHAFLVSRDIRLPWGTPGDAPGFGSVCAIGNRKNEAFQRLLKQEGAKTDPFAAPLLQGLRESGHPIAVATSSRNGRPILEQAGLSNLADVVIDGFDIATLRLNGKPAPDTFLEAARRLSLSPGEVDVVEDAVSGVQAGRAGGFSQVIAVDRLGEAAALREAGADLVVSDMFELALHWGIEEPGVEKSGLFFVENASEQ
jgi:HAD superfamily hydrolase (TIGR01509 family)